MHKSVLVAEPVRSSAMRRRKLATTCRTSLLSRAEKGLRALHRTTLLHKTFRLFIINTWSVGRRKLTRNLRAFRYAVSTRFSRLHVLAVSRICFHFWRNARELRTSLLESPPGLELPQEACREEKCHGYGTRGARRLKKTKPQAQDSKTTTSPAAAPLLLRFQ